MGKFRTPILIIIAMLPFISLGSSEIQPWDEGLYAVRAKAIVEHNAIWDQTEYSLGGLYSSTYPPLSVWAIAGSMSIFGDNLFSIRLFSALCSFFSVFLIYIISRRIFDEKLSLIVSLLLSGTTIWNHFSRQAMTDVPLVFFFLLGLVAIFKVIETSEDKKSLLWALVFSISFFCALMTKIVVSLLPLAFVIFAFFMKISRKKKILLILASICSIALSSIWYFYMAGQYGSDFTNALLAPHLYSAVEQNISRIGVLYYLNQILVANPFLILTFVAVIYLIIKFTSAKNLYNSKEFKIIIFFLSWFLILFIIFSLAPTKMAHYALYFIVPSILLAVTTYPIIFNENISSKIKLLILWLVLVAFFWSFFPNLRIKLRGLDTLSSLNIYEILIISGILISLFFLLLVKTQTLNKIPEKFYSNMFISLLVVLILRVFISNLFFHTGYAQGGYNTAQVLLNSNKNSFVYLYHEHSPADSLNPQLAYYTGTWMLNKDTLRKYHPIPLDENKISFDKLKELDKYPDEFVVYYIPENLDLVEYIIKYITKKRAIYAIEKEIKSSNYIIFGIIKERLEGNEKPNKLL